MTTAQSESDRLYDEIIAVHTVVRRGAALLRAALDRPPATAVEVDSCVGLGRWLVGYVHQHQRNEADILWPPLAEASPSDECELHDLTLQHTQIDRELDRLARRLDRLTERCTTSGRLDREAVAAAATALDAASRTLTDHFDEEESLLKALFSLLDDPVVSTLRAAAARNAPSTRPDLVLGLMSDPTPTIGYAAMFSSIPLRTRVLRPLLVARYHSNKRRLGLAA
jgi:hemerythrin-like domain-containing protein